MSQSSSMSPNLARNIHTTMLAHLMQIMSKHPQPFDQPNATNEAWALRVKSGIDNLSGFALGHDVAYKEDKKMHDLISEVMRIFDQPAFVEWAPKMTPFMPRCTHVMQLVEDYNRNDIRARIREMQDEEEDEFVPYERAALELKDRQLAAAGEVLEDTPEVESEEKAPEHEPDELAEDVAESVEMQAGSTDGGANAGKKHGKRARAELENTGQERVRIKLFIFTVDSCLPQCRLCRTRDIPCIAVDNSSKCQACITAHRPCARDQPEPSLTQVSPSTHREKRPRRAVAKRAEGRFTGMRGLLCKSCRNRLQYSIRHQRVGEARMRLKRW